MSSFIAILGVPPGLSPARVSSQGIMWDKSAPSPIIMLVKTSQTQNMQIRKMFIIPSLLTVMHGYTGHIILTWHIEDKKKQRAPRQGAESVTLNLFYKINIIG